MSTLAAPVRKSERITVLDMARIFPILFATFLLSSSTVSAQETAVLEWAKKFGNTGADRAGEMVVDASGNVYATGYFSGTVDFDPGAGTTNLTSTGGIDIFISKHDANGNLIWAKSMGGTGGERGFAIAIDNSQNVYITGGFTGTADFDPGSETFTMTSATAGEYDVFIVKLDANGNFGWAKGIIGGTWWDNGNGIAVDGSGNVFITGRVYFQGGARDFDPGPGTFFVTIGHEDSFILKLDNNGNFVWVKMLGGVDEDRGFTIELDGFGNVYSTGYFESTVDFDPGAGTFNMTASGDWDVFVSKLDNDGNFVWAKQMVNSTSTYHTDGHYGHKLTLDADGNVYTTGRYAGTVDFDPNAGVVNMTSAGSYDIFITKLSTAGNFLWAKSMGGSGYDEGFDISTDASRNVYLTGFFVQTVDFDPGAGIFNLTATGSNDDIFILKLDENGDFNWAGSMGGSNDDQGYSIDLDNTGNVYTLSWFTGTADFAPGACVYNLTSAGGDDFVIQKFRQTASPTPTISSFLPTIGPVGTLVTINGSGFSPTPGNNDVKFFNTVTATVNASTETSITVVVPAGAVTGKISVTANCVTATSATDFTITTAEITITAQPQNVQGCPDEIITFSTAASGTTNLAYQWQIRGTDDIFSDLTNGGAFSGISTATLTVNIAENVGSGRYRCRITGDGAAEVITNEAAILIDLNCGNEPPVIETTTQAVQIGGTATIDLASLISDPDNNLDLSTLQLLSSVSEQGAAASINASFELILDYNGVLFTGIDHVTISVCDILEQCSEQELTIEVGGSITVYNALSLDNNGLNEKLILENINVLEDTRKNHVTIFNRWGDVVFEVGDYNNEDHVFIGVNKNGKDLPSGTYYYKIEFQSGQKTKTGYLSLKR